MTNWYVRPTQQGAHTGADWNNAWSIPGIVWASVQPGDTVWIAGGSYPSASNGSNLSVGAAGTLANKISILRATAGDTAATGAAGWQSTFDSPAVLVFGGIHVPTGGHLIIDGRTASGFLITMPPTGSWCSVGASTGNVTDVFLSHFEIAGTANLTGLTAGRYAFQWDGFGGAHTVTNVTFDHMIIHDVCNGWRPASWQTVTIQYCQVWNLDTDNIDHCDLIYIGGDCDTVVFRYNTCYNSTADGILFESGLTCTNWLIYGNVIYNYVYSIITIKTGTSLQIGLYNNVLAGPAAGYAFLNEDGTLTGSFCENNIFYNCINGWGGAGVTCDYNGYYPKITNGYSQPVPAETHSKTLAALPFVNSGGGDFHITASAAASVQFGTPLANDGFLNKDMDGNTRTTWDVGAYEYVTGGGGPPPGITVRAGSLISPAGYRGPAVRQGLLGPRETAGPAGPAGPAEQCLQQYYCRIYRPSCWLNCSGSP